MIVDGQQVLSRATVTAGRALLTAAATVILASWYDIKLEGLAVLGVSPPPEKLNGPFAWGITLIFAGYMVNWITDLLSYVGWNSGERVQKQSEIGGAKAEALNSRIEYLIWSLGSIQKTLKKEAEAGEPRASTLERLDETKTELASIRRGVNRLGIVGGLFVYGWHGIVPLTAYVWALLILT